MACGSCYLYMFGPYTQQYFLVLLIWMFAVIILRSFSTRVEASRGTRKPEAVRSPWKMILFVLFTSAFGSAVLGPGVLIIWAGYFFISSLMLLAKPKPVPLLCIGLAVALALSFKAVGTVSAGHIEAMGGEQMWILKSQRSHSREMMRLSREATPAQREDLLRRAELRDDIPEANLKWLRSHVEQDTTDTETDGER